MVGGGKWFGVAVFKIGGEERVVGDEADDRDQGHMLRNYGSDLRIGLLRLCLPYDYLSLSSH